tara:strand:+ start:487 stop:843 length:357 start_codon:yes stop_codon:yes gene_type:complete
MTNKIVPVDLAIDEFLRAIKDAAAESPSFRARLVDALGYTVLYEGAEQFEGANPVRQANQWSEDAFCRIWSGAKVGDIKKVLKDYELATNDDMKGLKKAELIALLYERASSQAVETGI